MATDLVHNGRRLVRTRLVAQVQPAAANRAVDPAGVLGTRPGQGGVVTGIGLGDPAGGWQGDHVEPGVSLGHPDPQAAHALRLFACVGNPVIMVDGPAAGARGIVYGKHGAVLAMFAPADLARIAPGEWATLDACGVGLAIEGEPGVTFHSTSPDLVGSMASRAPDGRIRLAVAATLPPVAAAAGIGMPAAMFNMDLNSAVEPVASLARDLRFGDCVAVLDQDHRHGRRHRPGWVMVGVISHGITLAGGHGFGLMTLVTGPADRFDLVTDPSANVARHLSLIDGGRP